VGRIDRPVPGAGLAFQLPDNGFFIVGSSLKRGGRLEAAVDPRRVERLARGINP